MRPISLRAARCAAIVAWFLCCGPVRSQDCPLVSASPGFLYAERIIFDPAVFVGGLAYAPDGQIVAYENGTGEIRLHSPAGSRMLAKFDPPVFGSFLVLAPPGASVLFGESTGSNIYSVPLAGGDPVILDHISYAYDLALDSQGRGFVSAPGSNGNNSIRLLDADPGMDSKELVVDLVGFSGPVAVDPDGNVYYGTANGALEAGQRILRFSKDLIESAINGPPLGEADGGAVMEGAGGFYGLKWVGGGRFLYTDLGFVGGTGGLYLADPAEASIAPVASFCVPEGILSPSYLDYRPGTRPFGPGAGPAGGSALVAFSDFSTVSRAGEILPELHFVRGRVNSDSIVDLSDAVAILGYLFTGGEAPEVIESADVNDDDILDLSDPIYLLDYLFRGGPVIPQPFPELGSES